MSHIDDELLVNGEVIANIIGDLLNKKFNKGEMGRSDFGVIRRVELDKELTIGMRMAGQEVDNYEIRSGDNLIPIDVIDFEGPIMLYTYKREN